MIAETHADFKLWLVTVATLAFAWGPAFLAIAIGIVTGRAALRRSGTGRPEKTPRGPQAPNA